MSIEIGGNPRQRLTVLVVSNSEKVCAVEHPVSRIAVNAISAVVRMGCFTRRPLSEWDYRDDPGGRYSFHGFFG